MKRAFALGLALVLTRLSAAPAAEERPAPADARIPYGKPRLLCTLKNARIRESSGLAPSRRTDGVFWTHNDSGDGARLYAFNTKGEDLGSFVLPGIRPQDCEDMASFRLDGKPYLLLADVGDNQAKRRSGALYLVEEPALPKNRKPGGGLAAPVRVIRFQYEGRPTDCESVAVDVSSRTIYLASKVAWPTCRIYELPLPKGKAPRRCTAKAVSKAAAPLATAMAMSADGTRCVLLTYGPALEFVRRAGETWKHAFARKPRSIPMPRRKQGESICYGSDDRTLYLTSEGSPCPLWQVPAVADDQ